MFFAPILCLLAAWAGLGAAAEDNIRKIPLRTHSISAPYLDSDMQSRWFDFGGDVIVRADKYIRLSSDLQSRTGWLFSKIPLTATNWEVEFEFKIHGKSNLHGDGFALWVTKQRAMPGPVFGSVDKFEGLGIFFDTYKNNRPGTIFPYVMAMVGDGQTSYDKETDGKEQELAGCSARGLRRSTTDTKARLTYFQDKSLKLELKYQNNEDWTTCFEAGDVTLPSVSYLGFSAETGELSDNFDIVSVETSNLYQTTPGETTAGASRPGGRGGKGRPTLKQSSGWGWTLVKIILFFGICGLGYAVYTTYRTSKKRSSRFD